MAFADMNALIRGASPEQIAALRVPPEGKEPLRLDALVPRAPIPFPLQDVLCLGINYYDHLTEAGRFDRAAFGDRPRTIYFSKRVSEANWNGGAHGHSKNILEAVKKIKAAYPDLQFKP